MKFQSKKIIGILNPKNSKILVKGKYCDGIIIPEIEIDLFDNCIIILVQPNFIGSPFNNLTTNDWINFVMVDEMK